MKIHVCTKYTYVQITRMYKSLLCFYNISFVLYIYYSVKSVAAPKKRELQDDKGSAAGKKIKKKRKLKEYKSVSYQTGEKVRLHFIHLFSEDAEYGTVLEVKNIAHNFQVCFLVNHFLQTNTILTGEQIPKNRFSWGQFCKTKHTNVIQTHTHNELVLNQNSCTKSNFSNV